MALDVTLPTLPLEYVAAVVVAFMAGAACPAYYAQERLRGFGRAVISRLPYTPPPGKSEEEALADAVEDAGDDGGG